MPRYTTGQEQWLLLYRCLSLEYNDIAMLFKNRFPPPQAQRTSSALFFKHRALVKERTVIAKAWSTNTDDDPPRFSVICWMYLDKNVSKDADSELFDCVQARRLSSGDKMLIQQSQNVAAAVDQAVVVLSSDETAASGNAQKPIAWSPAVEYCSSVSSEDSFSSAESYEFVPKPDSLKIVTPPNLPSPIPHTPTPTAPLTSTSRNVVWGQQERLSLLIPSFAHDGSSIYVAPYAVIGENYIDEAMMAASGLPVYFFPSLLMRQADP